MSDLSSAPYVSLATFRRNGNAVPTPVWAAEVDGAFYMFSASNAGKVKRLRNSSKAQLAVCDMRGKLLGEWHDAEAELITDASEVEKGHRALRAKYGWQMWIADIGSKMTGRFDQRAYIRITVKSD